MTLFDGKFHKATKDDCKQPWYGGTNGKWFRCGLCGHKFNPGDEYMGLFTNNIPGAGGNPLICKQCHGSDVIDRWVQHCKDSKSDKFWFFRRGER